MIIVAKKDETEYKFLDFESPLVFGLVLAAFLFFFAIENFIWLGKISDTNPIFSRAIFL